ncbi:MAG: disulfide bond formation protein B [Rhabdochlamydiaceae bacterium]|nr:disulfide bond formation protein B [Candidatus Amphrikana amoebophyrae]
MKLSYFKHYSLYLAWLISLIATFMSLYFGEIAGSTPCTLCWYQRICLFPLIIILGYATYRHFPGIVNYVLALPVFGALFALYQLMMRFYVGKHGAICPGTNPCIKSANAAFDSPFFIPIFSLVTFILIGFFLILAKKKPISIDTEEE